MASFLPISKGDVLLLLGEDPVLDQFQSNIQRDLTDDRRTDDRRTHDGRTLDERPRTV